MARGAHRPISGAGAVLLTFLAGAEFEPEVLKSKAREVLIIGFLTPFYFLRAGAERLPRDGEGLDEESGHQATRAPIDGRRFEFGWARAVISPGCPAIKRARNGLVRATAPAMAN
jgi:hypothetical protein